MFHNVPPGRDRRRHARPALLTIAALALAPLAPVGCSSATVAAAPADQGEPSEQSAPGHETAAASIPAPGQRSPGSAPAGDAIPGLGPDTMKKIPKKTRQVVVSSTETKKGTRAHTTLYRLTGDGSWTAVKDWPGHNGANGWKKDRTVGDKSSPIGVFGLTDAGGYLKDPGTELTYDRDSAYRTSATATYGPRYRTVFNYVIAINYNRVPGSEPTDSRHPHGAARGGKIWLHVDHDGPTHGCITLSQSGVKFLLTHLDPAAHPVIVTGPEPVISD